MRPPHWPLDGQTSLPRLRTISQLWALAAVLSALGVLALAADVPLAGWLEDADLSSSIRKLFSLSEAFGHAVGVLMILAAIVVLDPQHRALVPRIAAASLGSGLLANVFKLLVARTRPQHFNLESDALDSFVGWFPLLGNTSWDQGFPSSHTATAGGLAVALACLYPRGAWLFSALVVLAGGQRMLVGAHFLSDVLWGAAVGCVFAPLCVYGSIISRTFDRWELSRRASDRATAQPNLSHQQVAPTGRTNADDLPTAA